MRHAQWFASQFLSRSAARGGKRWGSKVGPIGIEFRDGYVRVVQVARDRRAHVVAAACVACDRNDPARSMEQVIHALLGCGFRGRECVVVLPFEAARLETMNVADGEDDVVRADILRALRGANGSGAASAADAAERLQFDFIRLGAIGHAGCEIAVVVADREPIEAIVHPLIDAGFRPSAVETSFVAVARACSRTHRRASDHSRVRLALDLCEAGATALLLQGQTIVSARTCASRHDAVEALASCLRASSESLGLDRPTEVRVSGSHAYDVQLMGEIERALSLPVRHDDDLGTFAAAFAEVGVHAMDRAMSRHHNTSESGGAAAWMGAFGAAFRGVSRAALRHAPTQGRVTTQANEREAA